MILVLAEKYHLGNPIFLSDFDLPGQKLAQLSLAQSKPQAGKTFPTGVVFL